MLPYTLLAVAGAILLFGAAELAHTTLSGDALPGNAPPNIALAKDAPAGNVLSMNALGPNAAAQKTRAAVGQNPLARTASAVADPNGVVVEGISAPQPAQR